MPQIFHSSANTIAKASIFGAVFLVGAIAWVAGSVQRSPYTTDQGVVRDQPVPFSHEHHVRGLGIDCRYCHTSVESSSFAGLPPTQTCMTCHSQIWTNAQILEPVRQSFATGKPLRWNRVHNLPNFVYFNHSIHIAKGVGCATCHGQVDRMPLMWQHASLQMNWCLQCHRDPEKFLRPRSEVFNMNWQPPTPEHPDVAHGNATSQLELGKYLVKEYGVRKDQITNCSVCHR
jgi:hypothetical protein